MLIGGLMCFTADSNGVAIIGFILVLLGVLSLLRAAIARWTTEIAVTNRRVIFKHGVIRRDTIEIKMPQVESVDVRQSILGRLLNYGTVLVRGTGGGLNPLAYVSAPLPLRRAVQLSGQTSVSPALTSAIPRRARRRWPRSARAGGGSDLATYVCCPCCQEQRSDTG